MCFARRSVVNLSDCQFTTNAPLVTFVMLIIVFLHRNVPIFAVVPLSLSDCKFKFRTVAVERKEFGIRNSKLDLRVIRQVIR